MDLKTLKRVQKCSRHVRKALEKNGFELYIESNEDNTAHFIYVRNHDVKLEILDFLNYAKVY
jgi:aspartate aminotransferase-like enzyme